MWTSDDPSTVADFLDVLVELDVVPSMNEALRHPYRYQAIFDYWKESDYPLPESEQWTAFSETILFGEESEDEENDEDAEESEE